MSFSAQVENTPPDQNVVVSNGGGGTLSWTGSKGASAWLVISPTSGGNSPTSMTVSINATGLTAGTYNGTITISAVGATNTPQSIAVSLTMSNPQAATTNALTGTSKTTGGFFKN